MGLFGNYIVGVYGGNGDDTQSQPTAPTNADINTGNTPVADYWNRLANMAGAIPKGPGIDLTQGARVPAQYGSNQAAVGGTQIDPTRLAGILSNTYASVLPSPIGMGTPGNMPQTATAAPTGGLFNQAVSDAAASQGGPLGLDSAMQMAKITGRDTGQGLSWGTDPQSSLNDQKVKVFDPNDPNVLAWKQALAHANGEKIVDLGNGTLGYVSRVTNPQDVAVGENQIPVGKGVASYFTPKDIINNHITPNSIGTPMDSGLLSLDPNQYWLMLHKMDRWFRK